MICLTVLTSNVFFVRALAFFFVGMYPSLLLISQGGRPRYSGLFGLSG
jgi:hypothetical protein